MRETRQMGRQIKTGKKPRQTHREKERDKEKRGMVQRPRKSVSERQMHRRQGQRNIQKQTETATEK